MDSVESSQTKAFQFTGNAREYFKIWIVNIMLSIITLGIYAPWAKVRSKRYFYGNTILDGSAFEYLADPLDILKSRIIVFAVILVYYLAKSFNPMFEFAFIILILLATPWLVVKALIFNARVSAFRNIRFNFDGGVKRAAFIFILLPILMLVTLGLALPYLVYKQNQFIIGHFNFGTTQFEFNAGLKSFYGIYLKALGILVLVVIIASVALTMVAPDMMQAPPAIENIEPMNDAVTNPVDDNVNMNTDTSAPPQPPPPNPAAMVALGLYMLLYMYLGIYIKTATTNLIFNSAQLGAHGFSSKLRTKNMFYIYMSNIFIVLLSVGLLIPWARIRLARYRINQLNLEANGSLNDFVSSEAANVKATGEEFADALDFGIGL